MYARILKFNKHHDASGRFSRGSTSTASVVQSFKDLKQRGVSVGGIFGVSRISGDGLNLEELADSWMEHTGGKVTPHEILDTLIGSDRHLADLDGKGTNPTAVDMTFDTDGKLTVHGMNVQVHGVSVDVITRVIDFEKKDVEHTFLEVTEGERGGGLAKTLFQSSIPLYKRMGMESISTYADLDAGGYVWGRFGFTSKDGSGLADISMATRDRLAQKVEDPSKLPPKVKKEWDALHKFMDNGEKLANSPNVQDNDKVSYFPNAFTSLKLPNLAKHLGHKESKDLMKELLFKTGWNGELRFNDKKAMNQLAKYLK